jgi:hypothetical protein
MEPYMHKILSIAFLCASLAPAIAQSFDATSAGGPVSINAAWRFHTGDDLLWASPVFDDSHWSLLRIDKAWAEQGYKGCYGFSWYRIRLKLPATRSPLALAVTEINSANEIYADGQFIGSIGKMRPAPVWLAYSVVPHSFPLPLALNGKTITLAIRVWQPEDTARNYPFVGRATNPSVGSRQTVDRLGQFAVFQYAISIVPDWIVSAVAAAIGLFSIGLFLLRLRSTEYAWAALFLLCDGAQTVGSWCYRAYFWPAHVWIFAANCIEAAMVIFWLLFIWRFLRAPADKLLRTAVVLLLLAPIPSGLAVPGYISVDYADLVWVFVPLILCILVFARLVRLAWTGNHEAQLLLVPFLLSSLMTAFMQFLKYLYYTNAINTYSWVNLYRGPLFSVTWVDVSSLLAYLCIAALLLMRFTRTAERDERLSAEMEAARRVQTQLAPTSLPVTPNFLFAVRYLAASEVGGDFYQVFPFQDGSVLIAIGDVSGKGLKAAMLGTLVVGALRTLAQENLPPSRILGRLNKQLVESSKDGFVTCLVLRISPAGSTTVANAGHLAPYLAGKELAIDNGLPLGLDASSHYPETCFEIPENVQLTLLSDGVVEARSSAGELFGFDRTEAISGQSASNIAGAAQQFGQEDDITVLTLIRHVPTPAPLSETSPTPLSTPA